MRGLLYIWTYYNKKYKCHTSDRIGLGSISISSFNYPFSAFCIGYLTAKTNLSIQVLFDFLEALDQLVKDKMLSQPLVKQILQLMEQAPEESEVIVKGLKQISAGKILNVISWIESFYDPRPPSPGRNQQTESLDNLTEEMGDANIRNDGTMELEDLLENQDQLRRKQQEQDIKMALKMQQEMNKSDKQIGGEQQQVPCQICYVNLFDDQVQTLECGHIFHKNCLAESFKNNISSNLFPIRCPNDDCKLQAKQNDLKFILSKEMFEKYQKHTLKAYADEHGDSISWCPTANCGYMFFFEKDDQGRFQCLECKKDYCLNCRVEWHADMTCKQYKISSTTSEDDEKFMSFVKGKKFKQCPKCKFWVEKNEGCDHMTCKCKFQFCYKCGGVYMKCECVQKARQEQQNRRRQLQQRNRLKLERKRLAVERKLQKQERKRQIEEQKRRKQDETTNRRSSRRKR